MVLRSRTNPYPGINIHLNSYLQARSEAWVSYHSDHLTNIREHLDRNLPENYYSQSESSLQLGGFDAGTGIEVKDQVRPDINIFREQDTEINISKRDSTSLASPNGTLNILDTIEIDEDDPLGLVIYSVGENTEDQPVARLELLSPSNKIGGTYYSKYASKRLKTLEAGLVLVEIDYLHASRPVIPNLPSYPDNHSSAYPYTVLISDPRPSLLDGKTDIYVWHVDDDMPAFAIPLLGSDKVTVELGKVYNYTYETTRRFHSKLDYSDLPTNFDTYTDADQQKIKDMLAKIREQLERDA